MTAHAKTAYIMLVHDLIRKPVPIPDQVEDKLFGIMHVTQPTTS
jgi:hypothetical protein